MVWNKSWKIYIQIFHKICWTGESLPTMCVPHKSIQYQFTVPSQFQQTKGFFQTCIWSNDVPLHLHDLHSYSSEEIVTQNCKKQLKGKDFTTPPPPRFHHFPKVCKANGFYTKLKTSSPPHTKLHKKDNIFQHCTNNQVWEWTHTKILKVWIMG
jgi:hypothetical protein